MEISRVITHPSTVEKQSNNTVVVIDATEYEVEQVGRFCQISDKNYDIYLYKEDVDDLIWLSDITNAADCVLIAENSKVLVNNTSQIQQYGKNQRLNTPLAYFQEVDKV
jgi:hypothetical protein